MRVAERRGMRGRVTWRRGGGKRGFPTTILNLRRSRGFLNGEHSDAPGNFYQSVAVQAGHFKIELIPGEFRVTGHQGLEVTIRNTLEKLEDLLGNGFLLRHQLPPRDNTPSPRSGDSV